MKTENNPFVNRIELYSWLEKYMKAGNNIICFQSAIKNKEIKIPFDISKKEALIIINDFIANNKKKVESNKQLQLFPIV